MRNVRINEDGHIVVKNLSAYWIPKIKVERAIHGTVYTVTGSYEGTELPSLTQSKPEEKWTGQYRKIHIIGMRVPL